MEYGKTRVCMICDKTKKIDEFNYVHDGYKDSYCRTCRKAYQVGYKAGRNSKRKALNVG